MRRSCAHILVVFVSALFASHFASAQGFPKAEIFGGYSFLHIDTGHLQSIANQVCQQLGIAPCPVQVQGNANGWEAAAQLNLNSWFGVKADFAGHYNTPLTFNFTFIPGIGPVNLSIPGPSQDAYDFLFGPVFSQRRNRDTVFVHTLVGAEHLSFGALPLEGGFGTVPAPPSNSYFAFALGGGVDFKLSHHMWVRAGQFDYQFVNGSINNNSHSNDFRFSAGIVYAFGGK